MAKYWIYLNDQVAGPFSVEQLIRQRGFSRQTQICVDDNSGRPGAWTSPAEIPELAPIFKAVDEWSEPPAAAASGARQGTKPPTPRPAPKPAPAMSLSKPRRSRSSFAWLAFVGTILAAGGYAWVRFQEQQTRHREQASAQQLVETAALPSGSLYSRLRDYLEEKPVERRWNFERTPIGLWNVSLSIYGQAPGGSGALTLYAFEVNLQAQSVRALNSAAHRLLSEGFRRPSDRAASRPRGDRAGPAAPSSTPRQSPGERWKETLSAYQRSANQGDFEAVWNSFSARKRSEMLKAGISQDGFVRVQSLTRGLESGLEQTLLKTKQESESRRLVLWRQSQPKHSDIFVKQTWVLEDKEWKLDQEEKRSAETPGTPSSPPPILSLPGLSN